MKFYLDEDISPRVAVVLRKRGIDVVSTHDVGNIGLTDSGQLAFAAREKRGLVTRNARDFVEISREAVRRHEPHAGIILCPPTIRGHEVGHLAAALARVSQRFPQGLGEYDVIYLGSLP